MKAYRDAHHLILDIETLGVELDCPIIQIGAVKIEKVDGMFCTTHSFAKTISVDSNIRHGFTNFSEDTIAFWSIHKTQLINIFTESTNTIRVALSDFSLFCQDIDFFWSRGSHFDFPILENAFKKLDVPIPWHYWQVRDIRTLQDYMFFDMPNVYSPINTHHALEDCMNDAQALVYILENKGIKHDT